MRRPASLALAAVTLALGLAACGNEVDRTTAPETVVGEPPAETGGAETGGADTGGADTGAAGEEVQGDPAAGEAIFAEQGCGQCHTLAAAGSSGAVGPNLDESQPTFELVVERVTNGLGGMPSFSGSLSPEQIDDVAAYVVQATSG
jgi:mono/diheme cytochrome c family protein